MAQASAAVYPPIPDPSDLTRFYWEAVNQGRLEILCCNRCGHFIHWPRPVCNRCLSLDLSPKQVSGKGRLYSWTVMMAPIDPYFATGGPHVYAIVELDEEPGLRVVSNLIDIAEADIRLDMPVEVVFKEVAPGLILPLYRPA